MSWLRRERAAGLIGCALLVVALGAAGALANRATRPQGPGAQDEPPAERTFAVSAQRYRFDPARIEVTEGDVVRITLTTKDIPHSFTIDAYRLAKRVSPGHPVTFEFRADKAGTFPYYCNLKIDDGCRNMKGQLVVRPRR